MMIKNPGPNPGYCNQLHLKHMTGNSTKYCHKHIVKSNTLLSMNLLAG